MTEDRSLVAIYGMSFSARIGEALEKLDKEFVVRLKGGPAGAVSRSYAEYVIDRNFHNAPVVVLGVLASSVPATSTTTHMTWNFEAPGSHFYPRFYIEEDRLVHVQPPVNSLSEFRHALNSKKSWTNIIDYLSIHDAYFEPFSFETDLLDHSALGRLLRRSWAQRHHRQVTESFYDGKNFTNHQDNLDLTLRIILEFSKDVAASGALPVVILIHDAGYGNALYRAAAPILESRGIDYVSTHEIVPADVYANFQPDGHFQPQFDTAIAAEVLKLIRAKRSVIETDSKGS